MTHYETLNIQENATDAEIRKAYRVLSKIYHPDIVNTGDQDKFTEILTAYNILSNPNEKAVYDRTLASNGGGGKASFKAEDQVDIFSGLYTDRNNKAKGKRGQNRTAELSITLAESIAGVTKDVVLRISETCAKCMGTGKISSGGAGSYCSTCHNTRKVVVTTVNIFGGKADTTNTCPDCRDKPVVTEEEECDLCSGRGSKRATFVVPVKVPAGIENNKILKIKEAGEFGSGGGERGDLHVLIKVEEDDKFTRVGPDILFEQVVSYAQLVLGASIDVVTYEGKVVTLVIPKATKPGTEIRMEQCVVKNPNSPLNGNLVAKLELNIPTDLTERQEEILRNINF